MITPLIMLALMIGPWLVQCTHGAVAPAGSRV